ncbi:hypothetical protein P9204_14925 [Geobacillus stearothermophilus]|nr:hypothetical protein [Geobacillus stearothermophilus]
MWILLNFYDVVCEQYLSLFAIRTTFGAYVLFPWQDEDSYPEHKFYKSINEVNIDGLPLLPNARSLVEQLIERLIEKIPKNYKKEGILPRGTMEECRSSLEEKVLVGMVPRKENYWRIFNIVLL